MIENVEQKTWLQKTNQEWKFRVFMILIYVVFCLLVLHIIGIVNNNSIEQLIVSICVIASMWLCFTIRCPFCKRRPMFQLLRKTNITHLYKTLSGFEKCPFCEKPDDEGNIGQLGKERESMEKGKSNRVRSTHLTKQFFDGRR